MNKQRTGFTLIEVIIASVIGAFIALVAVGTLKAVTVGAQTVDRNIDQAAQVRFAARSIAADLENLYLDRNNRNSKLVGTIEPMDTDLETHLVMHSVSKTKARALQPEGDVYEVEYYLLRDQQGTYLMKRLWPNPDEQSIPAGVLSVIAENIDVFNVRYFDGTEWLTEWPEEMQSIPPLVEVTIASGGTKRSEALVETFIINFAKATGVESGTIEENQEDTQSTVNQ
jgi:general secretion pathway protein J